MDDNNEILREIAINLTGEDPGTEITNNELLKIIAIATAGGGGGGVPSKIDGLNVLVDASYLPEVLGDGILYMEPKAAASHTQIAVPGGFAVYANTGVDGEGAWDAGLILNPTGMVELLAKAGQELKLSTDHLVIPSVGDGFRTDLSQLASGFGVYYTDEEGGDVSMALSQSLLSLIFNHAFGSSKVEIGAGSAQITATDGGGTAAVNLVGGAVQIVSVVPTSPTDLEGFPAGSIAFDDNYMYVKTSTNWKRTPLEEWVV